MKITALPKTEPSAKAWGYRLLLGPASLLDGLVETLTFGFYGIGAKCQVAMCLSKARYEAKK
jgi:hypothetical protein